MEEAMTPENTDGVEVETTKAPLQTEGERANVNPSPEPEAPVPVRKGILRGTSAEKQGVVLGKAQISFNATCRNPSPGPTAMAPLGSGAVEKVRRHDGGILINC